LIDIVFPAYVDVRAMFFLFKSLFISVDLPTLLLPTNAIAGKAILGNSLRYMSVAIS